MALEARAFQTDTLGNRLWHVTSAERYELIQISGAILPEPALDNSERWGTSQGPDTYPLVRHLGGVSLFDFEGFMPDAYEANYPMSNWYEFVPCPSKWRAAVWLEIDRLAVMSRFVGGSALIKLWNDLGLHRHRIMPHIEAAHLGPIPIASIVRVVPVSSGHAR